MLLASVLDVPDPHYFKDHKMIFLTDIQRQILSGWKREHVTKMMPVAINQINEVPMLRNKTAVPAVT
jgi:hypothetical protein